MPQHRTLKDTYARCESEGKVVPKETVNKKKVRTSIQIATEDLQSAKILEEKKMANPAHKLRYDALHTLTEAYLELDQVSSNNHQCLFAHLCIKHPELELDWEFFEIMRTKRNGIQYYGQAVTKQDCKEISLQTELYAQTLITAIKKKC